MDNFDKLKNPLTHSRRKLMPDLFSASLIVAMLGFFESTTASKSLGTTYNLTVSSNRELVALGCINMFISLFGALPSFGGYGRIPKQRSFRMHKALCQESLWVLSPLLR